jgi:negative regulator of flagellin synthesis FlgM
MNLVRIPPSGLFSILDVLRVQAASNQPANDAAGPTSSGGGDDRAEINPSARELSRALQQVDAAPDVRQSRVDELRAQVQAGTYVVDTTELARRLLGS